LNLSPAEAYQKLLEGNERFIQGAPSHPRQSAELRSELTGAQNPFAALFGCSDSRLAAEIIFDVGLGDLFVVRNAGQVISTTTLGSLEYSVEFLKVPLIVVLGHYGCGAIAATMDSVAGTLETNSDFIPSLVSKISPSVEAARQAGTDSVDAVAEIHIKATVEELISRSALIDRAVRSGKLGVVGAIYQLALGRVTQLVAVGNINQGPQERLDSRGIPH
jgi:carbonic anhydrase